MARVLVVEDEPLIRVSIAESLADEGFEVVTAADGNEAVQHLDSLDRLDILLTDIRLPGSLDGFAVADYARLLHPMLPVLVVSGYAGNFNTRFAALPAPAVFVRKPYMPSRIVQTVRDMLQAD